MLHRFSIRQVIIGAMAMLALLTLLGSAAMVLAASAVGRQMESQLVQLLADEEIAERIIDNSQRQMHAAHRYTITSDPVHLASFRDAGMAVYDEIRRYLFRDLGPDERRLVESIRERHEAIEVAAQSMFSVSASAEIDRLPEVEALNASLDSLIAMRRASSLRVVDQQRQTWSALYIASAVLVFVYLIALYAAARFLRARLVVPLTALSGAAVRIGGGDFEQRVQVTGGDELADVGRSFNDMAARLLTARRETAHAERRFQDLIEGLSTVVWESDAATLRCTYVSPQAESMFGYPAAQWMRTDIWQTLIHPEDHEAVMRQCRDSASRGVDHEIEYRVVCADGSVLWVRDFVRVLLDDDRQASRLRGVITDISGGRAADEALRASEERYHSLFDRIPVGLYRTTPDGRLLDGNRALLQLLGYQTREQMLSLNANDVYVAIDGRNRWREMVDETGAVVEVDRQHTRVDGSVMWVRDTARAVRDADGAVLYYEGALQDVTERVRAEEAVRRSEARFRSLIDNASDGVLILAGTGVIMYQSPAVERMLGFAPGEMVGRTHFDLVHPDDIAVVRDAYEDIAGTTGRSRAIEFRCLHQNGEWRVLQGIGMNLLHDPAVGGFVLNIIDTTVRRQLEQQLQHAQKMEAIGRLAGGIAHDFNNLLTAIQGYADLLGERPGMDEESRSDLLEIRRAVDSAARLTRQLLAFSRRQVVRRRPTDVCAVVGELDQMLRRLITEDVPLRTRKADDCWVDIDPGQLEQIVVNLVVNARDAKPASEITIEVETVSISHDADADAPGLDPGRYVVLSVSDDGHGIDADVLPFIFDPFFTTKDVGKGTGLGLATVYGIVEESGGRVFATSDIGTGTVMRVFLPQVEKQAAVDRADAEATGSRPGSETVLLVEDEAAVRSFAERVLRQQGYVVHSAGNGAEALDLLRNRDLDVDLLLTDVVMPVMGGVQLAHEVLAQWPAVQVLFISGYAADKVPGAGSDGRTLHFLEKPFSPAALGRAVRSILDDRPPELRRAV